MQEPNKPDIVTREGFAAAAAPLERLLLTAGYGVLRDWDAAADAVQSALLKAWRGRRSVKDPAKFKAWLVKIVVNESRDIVRRGFAAELKETAAEQPSDPDVKIDVRRAVDGPHSTSTSICLTAAKAPCLTSASPPERSLTLT